ncbi:hypothetical protein [Reichenbachiella sp. MALMAid0571]|uniref:hypothetical protein n=1 Tax=Reichenbachiella sp. MALMAid0571 TaxID=3143939 RepID=UPI0032DF06DD
MLRLIVLLLFSCCTIAVLIAQPKKITNKLIDYSDLKKAGTGFLIEFEYDKKNPAEVADKASFSINGISSADVGLIEVKNDKGIPLKPGSHATDKLPYSITKNILVLDKGTSSHKFTITYSPTGGTAIDHDLEIKATEKSTEKPITGATITTEINSYIAKANEYIRQNEIKEDRKRNIYMKGNQVYIFLSEDGSILKSDLPTTAIQEYVYHFIVISCKNCKHTSKLKLEVEGSYNPSYLNFVLNEDKELQSEKENNKHDPPIYEAIHYGSYGPFTDSFKVKVSKIDVEDQKKDQVIFERSVKIAKLYHVSISTGLFNTTLKNPQNIEIADRIQSGVAMGDSTLIADDPKMRGVITIMATYYPGGRSFLFPPTGNIFDPSRIGVLVGAQLNDNLQENFFLGLSSDFARGGSFAIGIHCGRRNFITGGDYSDFNYGTDKFIGELKVKKEWDIGIFFGAVIDARVALQLFKGIGGGDN